MFNPSYESDQLLKCQQSFLIPPRRCIYLSIPSTSALYPYLKLFCIDLENSIMLLTQLCSSSQCKYSANLIVALGRRGDSGAVLINGFTVQVYLLRNIQIPWVFTLLLIYHLKIKCDCKQFIPLPLNRQKMMYVRRITLDPR